MNLSISLRTVDAANASSSRQRTRAAGDRDSAAAEAELASLSIDQHYIAGAALVLQTKAEQTHGEGTLSGEPPGISGGAGNRSVSHREGRA